MPASDHDARRDVALQHLEKFGRRVKILRHAVGLSQEQLAHAAGLHRTVIGKIERGERDVGLSTLWPLADALGVEVAQLFGDGLPT